MTRHAPDEAREARATRGALRCPVRGCLRLLSGASRRWACASGHSFDQSRAGALNLLQPQDRRSRNPGDSKAAALARRRLAEQGHGRAIHEALGSVIRARFAAAHRGVALLDVGCGEGAFLRSLDGLPGLERHGLDLSAPAVDLAAKAAPGVQFVVGNADRFLPYADGSFDVVTSIDARVNAAEFARILVPQSLLLIAVPGPEDLQELRARVQGRGHPKARTERVRAILDAPFVFLGQRSIRETRTLGASALRDLLTATYRGGRHSEQAAVDALSAMSVTLAHDIMTFERR